MADDDLDDQYLVRRAIEDIRISHQFTTVNNGTQLMDLLLRRGHFASVQLSGPDCILLDLNMPLLDGFQTLGQLKANKDTSAIPVYVLSTSRSEKDRSRALELGASDFYVKPTRYLELKKILGDICIHCAKGQLPEPLFN
jgi:CheY-like chemotaxis protein